MNRDIKQKEAVEALLKDYSTALENKLPIRSILKAVMRFGKTKVILDFLSEISIEDVLIIVPNLANKKSWEIEIKKFYPELHYEIITYRSTHKLQKNEYPVIIFDEIHNLTENAYLKMESVFKNCYIILGLTGTLPRYDRYSFIFETLQFKVVYDLKLDEAIDLNIVNNFKIKVIHTELSNVKDIHVKTGKWDFKTSEKSSYKSATKKIAQNPCKRTFLNRSKLLYELKSKKNATKFLLTILPHNKKILIFTKRQEIAKDLSSNALVSNNSKEENNELLNKFIKNEIKTLASVEMINEGVTIPDIDIVIIEAFDSNKNNLLQRIGRSLMYEKDKTILIFIMVSKNTIEYTWLNKIIPEKIEVEHYAFNYGNIKKINYEYKPDDNKYFR